jgi:type II secretory pathway pseudopilin PulG
VSALDIVLIAVAAVLLVIVLAGWRRSVRAAEARDAALLRDLSSANEALARAHAADNGWDRATMEAAAREAFGGEPEELQLVQVIDRPGTEEDEAVFHAVAAGRTTEVRLRRSGDSWRAG